MAFHINKTVEWKAGEGTPVKYSFNLDADVSVVSFVSQVATISVVGTVTATNHPNNSRNSFAASDFAVLVPGDVDISAHPFINGVSYYEQALPFLPDPQNGDTAKMLVQFRGDTWISDPNNNANRVSLWTQNAGNVLNQYDQEGSNQFSINATFTITINTSGDTPILAWDSSGANNSTDYSWLDRQVWATWFDLDYRPGAILDTNVWRSHNRSGGTCHVLSNTTGPVFTEMRTIGAPTAMGNPPSVFHDNKWYNMARIGKE